MGLAATAAGDPVTFTEHSYGHGRGMGQHGAYGYARSGCSHEQLLARYYGNTVPTQQGNPVMTVRLVGQHNRAVDVFSLLIVTADEGDDGSDNRIATIVSGAHVAAGRLFRTRRPLRTCCGPSGS